ncbi:MAG: hydroxymethylpyrimidine/phosphomethylpyrimidine kinase [Coriobacteriales bacterium]
METCILAIGGSDSSAGAGIQADVKTAAALGVHAATALTCVTVQSTSAFGPVQLVDPGLIEAQVTAAFEDLPVAAVKVGMLGSPEAAVAVARALAQQRAGNPELPIVVDPVLAATTDSRGPREVVGRAICRHLLPLASLLTPNLPEGRTLAGYCQQMLAGSTTADNTSAAEPQHASGEVLAAWSARTLMAAGAAAVLVKGGHCEDGPTVRDLLFGPAASLELALDSALLPSSGEHVPAVRVHVGPGQRDAIMSRPIGYSAPRREGEFHGTGCVLSTAIACGLACGLELPRAVGEAHALLQACMECAWQPGSGSKLLGPLSGPRPVPS